MASLATFPVWTDDDGSGMTGSIIDNAELQKIKDAVALDVTSANFPNVTTKSIQDIVMAGGVMLFGGTFGYDITDTSYATGATGDKLIAGGRMRSFDTALLTGTYRLEGMLQSVSGGATTTVGLMNLTDAPNAAMTGSEISTSSTTPVRVRSSAITFPAAGTNKDYGPKGKVDTGTGFAWDLELVRTA